MRVVAVDATTAELHPTTGRALWDRELLYRSMVRWGTGRVVPIDGRIGWHTWASAGARGVGAIGSVNRRWRGSAPFRRLRDYAQIDRVRVGANVELLYGHIAFPVASGVPTLWSTAGVLEARPGHWFPSQSARTHERFVRQASLTQCWSELGRQGMLRWGSRIDPGKVRAIPPLVYVDLPPRTPPVGPDLTALFVGAAGSLKGLDVVLAAMRRLGPGIRLEVVTSDPAPASLPGNVAWLGPRPRDEVLARLASADIHVFPSRTESFGGVAVEALAAGIPQVVDADGVPAEIAGDSGLMVDGEDAVAVADAIEQLAGDAYLRARLADLARARYSERYSPEAIGPLMAKLIEDA